MKQDYVSRAFLPFIFGGLAVAVGMLAWGQVSEPQAAQERSGAPAAAQPNRATGQPAAAGTQQNQASPATAGQPAGQNSGGQNRQAAADARQAGERGDQRAASPGGQQRSGARGQQVSAWLGVYLDENKDNTQQGATVAQVYPSPGGAGGTLPG